MPTVCFSDLDNNQTNVYSLGKIPSTRFSHVSFSTSSPFRILYTSYALPKQQKRSFRLNLHKVFQTYFNSGQFHYISHWQNTPVSRTSIVDQRVDKWSRLSHNASWSIHGQHDDSMFVANLFSSNRNLSLQTTANVNLSFQRASNYISSSHRSEERRVGKEC